MLDTNHHRKFFIDGSWVDPSGSAVRDVINPSTERVCAQVSMGSPQDVDKAVVAARGAFNSFSRSTPRERADLLRGILAQYEMRRADIVDALSAEMGAPRKFALERQSAAGPRHLDRAIAVLEDYSFELLEGSTLIAREPIGVVGMITPWNWPIHQIVLKVAPAIAAGCTMVLKPSEIAPLSAIIWSEILEAAGVPNGVYNMVQGEGDVVGAAMSGHSGIDMVSFTGSTRAGILVAQSASGTVKRVAQELGGKSANILLADVNLRDAVTKGVLGVMGNSGQSCDAPTRLLVPRQLHDEAVAIAGEVANGLKVGDVSDEGTDLGPVASKAQFDKVQRLIHSGIAEGARLVAGGVGRPDHLQTGYFVRPTIFGDVRNDMGVAREEIFGPVLVIIPYDDEEEAISIANDTDYGLAAYVQSADLAAAQRVAARMRAGRVFINYPAGDPLAPFGGYKMSGNGRECGRWGLEEYLEVKAVIGHSPS